MQPTACRRRCTTGGPPTCITITPWNFPERPNLFYGEWDGEPDLDFICYTPEEIDKKLAYKGLVSTALEEGIVVERRRIGWARAKRLRSVRSG